MVMGGEVDVGLEPEPEPDVDVNVELVVWISRDLDWVKSSSSLSIPPRPPHNTRSILASPPVS